MNMGLRIKLLLPLAFLSLLLLTYLSGYYMPNSLANIEDEHRAQIERHVDSVAEALVPLLLARQLDTVYENLDALRERNADWVSVRLFDAEGRRIYPLRTSPPASQGVSERDIHSIERHIDYLDEHMGKLIVEVDIAPTLSATKRRHGELMALTLVIIIGYLATTGFVLERAAIRPVNLLAQASKRLAKGDFSATLPRTGNDEVGTLVNSFRNMRDTIRIYQAELKAAGSYNRSLIEASLDPLVTIDADGKITDVNAAAEHVTGYSREDLIGTDFSDYFTEPGRARAGYRRAFKEGTVRDYALELKHRDGRARPVLYNASVYRDEAGDVIGVFAAARDVTEWREAEGALKRLSQRNELILNSAGEGIYGTDTGGNISFVNPVAAEMLGFRVEELIQKNSHRLFHHTKADGTPYPLEECPLHKSLTGGTVHRGRDEVFWTREGRKIDVEHVNTPLVENGRTVGAVVVFKDITERRKAEEATRLAAAYHRSLIEASLDPLVTIGPDGRITDVNFSTECVTGYSREALIGTDFSDYFTEPDKALAGYQQVFREGMVHNYELEIRHRDGHSTPVLYNATVFRNERGETAGVFAAARDITVRKRMEEDLRRINEELDRRVRERTTELERKIAEIERINKLFVGRELRMVELKEKIKKLENRQTQRAG